MFDTQRENILNCHSAQYMSFYVHVSLSFVSLRVSDLRQFVVAARPGMAAREFVLMTTFPNKELSDESQTLQQANLLNAVIVQRLQ